MSKGRTPPPPGSPPGRHGRPTTSADLEIAVSGIYGAHTRDGLVELRIGELEPIVMEPIKARLVASWLIEAAESAETDHFLMDFFTKTAEIPPEQAVGLLREFRQFRDRERKSSA